MLGGGSHKSPLWEGCLSFQPKMGPLDPNFSGNGGLRKKMD